MRAKLRPLPGGRVKRPSRVVGGEVSPGMSRERRSMLDAEAEDPAANVLELREALVDAL